MCIDFRRVEAADYAKAAKLKEAYTYSVVIMILNLILIFLPVTGFFWVLADLFV